MKSAGSILMIRPCRFGYNSETAQTNSFQHPSTDTETQIQSRALDEFNTFAEKLSAAGVNVVVVDDTPLPHTPDSLFPNNWFSTHNDGTLVLYPMANANRRAEIRQDVVELLLGRIKRSHPHGRVLDLREAVLEGEALEGTGSMVLDREHRIAYVSRSPRSSERILRRFCDELGYRAVLFSSSSAQGMPIYHTNVVMSLGEHLAIVCFDALVDADEAMELRRVLLSTNKSLLEISLEQLTQFAGNMIELRTIRDERLWVCSTQAWESLVDSQQAQILAQGRVIHTNLRTIESLGGGSARCMIAELYW